MNCKKGEISLIFISIIITNRIKMRFGLLGASKTGISIAKKLVENGHTPVFLWNRSPERLENASHYVKFKISSPDLGDYSDACDYVIVSVADDAIEAVARSFVKINKIEVGKIFHTSGALNSEILPGNSTIKTGSFHPVISINSIEEGLRLLPATVFSCEGDLADELLDMADQIGKKGISLTAVQKKNIHLSAVFMNNYLSGLIEKLKIFNTDIGINNSEFQQLLEPITLQTIDRSWGNSIDKTLTGPIRRGDLVTVEKHLDILKKDQLLLNLYKDFGRILVNFIDTDKETIKNLNQLLKHDVNER